MRGPTRFGAAGEVAALALLCLLLRAPTFGLSQLFTGDESDFAIIASEITRGHWPFTTLFDHKPLGTYLHFAAAIEVFGDSPLATRILGWIVVTATALAARAVLAGPIGLRRETAFLLAAAMIVASMGFGGDSTLSEHFANLYLTLSALFVLKQRRSSMLVAGMFAGVACNSSYLAVPVVAGLLVGDALGKRIPLEERAWNWLLFAGGAAAATVAVLSPLFLFSDPADFFKTQFSFFRGYSNPVSLPVRLMWFAEGASVLLPMLAAGVAMFALNARRAIRTKQSTAPLVGMGIGAGIATMASGYASENYMLLVLPPMFLWIGAVARLARGKSQQVMLGAAIASSTVVIAIPGLAESAIGAADLVAKATRGDLRFDEPREIANIAAERLPPGRSVYTVCTPPVVYQLLHVTPPTKYFITEHLLVPRFAGALGIDVDRELDAVFAKQPAVVILGDVDQCLFVTPSAMNKVAVRASALHYRPYARFRGFTFLAAPRANP